MQDEYDQIVSSLESEIQKMKIQMEQLTKDKSNLRESMTTKCSENDKNCKEVLILTQELQKSNDDRDQKQKDKNIEIETLNERNNVLVQKMQDELKTLKLEQLDLLKVNETLQFNLNAARRIQDSQKLKLDSDMKLNQITWKKNIELQKENDRLHKENPELKVNIQNEREEMTAYWDRKQQENTEVYKENEELKEKVNKFNALLKEEKDKLEHVENSYTNLNVTLNEIKKNLKDRENDYTELEIQKDYYLIERNKIEYNLKKELKQTNTELQIEKQKLQNMYNLEEELKQTKEKLNDLKEVFDVLMFV
jgi:hypothetical protein